MSYDWRKEVEYEESKEQARREYSEFLDLQRKCGMNLGISLKEWVSAWEDERYEIMKALEKLVKTRQGTRMSRLSAEVKLLGPEALLKHNKNR